MNKKQKTMLWRIIVVFIMLAALFFTPESVLPHEGMARFFLYLIPYFIIGYDILRKAGKGIMNGQIFDENFLMAVATIGAIAVALYTQEVLKLEGEYDEAIAVMWFYQIGELFQSYAVGKSRRNISDLMDIRPDYANIERDGKLVQVDPDEVEVGTVIVVRPGEKVPIDGKVIDGVSALNTSALTGESMPRDVRAGDDITSGCINMTGVLRIETVKEFGESTVSKVLDLVENASSRKSKSEDFIAKFAKIYTPIVCYCALALAILPPLIAMFFGAEAEPLRIMGGHDGTHEMIKPMVALFAGTQFQFLMSPLWSEWIYRALTFLVISCPCALVISIPLSFFAGIGGASKAGVLVKGSNYLETLSQTGIVVFDKTGTLTQGVFEVSGVHHGTIPDDQLLEYAAYAESASSHPISKSLQRAYGKEIDRSRVSDIQEISGNGIVAKVDGHDVAIGNDKLMHKIGADPIDCTHVGTIIHVAVDGAYCGHILISDVIKPTSKAAIAALRAAGVDKSVMLTGDARAVAHEVGRTLGLDMVCSELLPADKVSKVEELLCDKPENKKLAFVGDGINDAPVLSRADIGIAMGAMGSDAAIEAADVVLMDDDPLKIAQAIRISRKCIGIVYQNTVFAIGIKLLCLVLGAIGIANMWMAIFADVGVTVLAVLNAIRALFVEDLKPAA